MEALKAECSDTGCKIQSLQAEIESIRALVRPPTSWSHDHLANIIPLTVGEMALNSLSSTSSRSLHCIIENCRMGASLNPCIRYI